MTSYLWLLHGDSRLLYGLPYSIALLSILLAHEMGHYLHCVRWNVRATLPFFGPSPTLLGTVGAFIWIRSPIYSRRSLFEIGIYGPLWGFAILLPILVLGVSLSRVTAAAGGEFRLGTPLLLYLLERIRFPGVPSALIALHPVAVAAWAGLLATAINLLPIGQLDGGHIVYAMFGARWHRLVSALALVGLGALGFLYWPWWLWAAVLTLFRRHPTIYDNEPLDKRRCSIGACALVLLMLSFAAVPVRIS